LEGSAAALENSDILQEQSTFLSKSKPFKMAFVNLNNVQFYQKPPSKPSTQKPRNALPRDNFRVAFVTNSGSQPAPLHNKADPTFKRDCQPKWSIGITRRQGHDLALQHEGDKAGAQGKDRACFRNELS
jgi:hypothetical protein